MKLTLKQTLMIAILTTAAFANAKDFKPSDDLSAFARASGTYSRSLVTDDEDQNGYLCTDQYRIDVKVDAAAHSVAVLTYIDGTMTSGGTRQQFASNIAVGAASASTMNGFNGVDVLHISGVAKNKIVSWKRTQVLWIGAKGKWEVDKTVVEFVSDSKIKIGDCTFRR